MSIAVVTVNWNRWELTRQCIEAVRRSTVKDVHIYVVDNASTDGSLEHFSDLGSDVTLIAHTANAGWSGGNNLGVTRALADGHDFLFLLNNDAELDPAALGLLLEAHETLLSDPSGPAPVLGAVERHRGGGAGFVRSLVDAATGIPSWTAGMDPAQQPALVPTAYVHGASLFAHRSVFERIGRFDERFFLNFDETDWCFRARRAGHAMLTVRDAVIVHEGSATIGGVQSPLNLYFYVRNRLLFADKHCTQEQRRALARVQQAEAQFYAKKGAVYETAFQTAVQDHAAKRFGDCPDPIRQLGKSTPPAAAAQAPTQPAAAASDMPKISCLMVTKGDLFPARFAIACYRRQTYPNRELVVVCDRPGNGVAQWIATLGDPSIRYIETQRAKLGMLRNVSVAEATGELVCQWDDDDLYHPRRLEFQQRQLAQSGGVAHFLSKWLMWWPAKRMLAISGERTWEGSMLAHKHVLPPYPNTRVEEDTILIANLVKNHKLYSSNAPRLYCYIFHGNNSWPSPHFQNLFNAASRVIPAELYDQEIEGLSPYFPLKPYAAEIARTNLGDAAGPGRRRPPHLAARSVP